MDLLHLMQNGTPQLDDIHPGHRHATWCCLSLPHRHPAWTVIRQDVKHIVEMQPETCTGGFSMMDFFMVHAFSYLNAKWAEVPICRIYNSGKGLGRRDRAAKQGWKPCIMHRPKWTNSPPDRHFSMQTWGVANSPFQGLPMYPTYPLPTGRSAGTNEATLPPTLKNTPCRCVSRVPERYGGHGIGSG